MVKRNPKEKQVVNDAIQYWRGFIDGVSWSSQASKEELKDKLFECDQLINDYKNRLQTLKQGTRKKKHGRSNRRN